jgi:hypothetical protein
VCTEIHSSRENIFDGNRPEGLIRKGRRKKKRKRRRKRRRRGRRRRRFGGSIIHFLVRSHCAFRTNFTEQSP